MRFYRIFCTCGFRARLIDVRELRHGFLLADGISFLRHARFQFGRASSSALFKIAHPLLRDLLRELKNRDIFKINVGAAPLPAYWIQQPDAGGLSAPTYRSPRGEYGIFRHCDLAGWSEREQDAGGRFRAHSNIYADFGTIPLRLRVKTSELLQPDKSKRRANTRQGARSLIG